MTAAELYEEAGDSALTLEVYQRYVAYFNEPIELNIETRNKISLLLKAGNDHEGYLKQLENIVLIDATAGDKRTPRTRYLASHAALVLAERIYQRFVAVRLVKPLEANLQNKQALMKEVTQQFNQLLDYEVAEVTAASTFYLAEVYAHFSTALMESERPDNLTPLELEQYELAIEEQAYPFEEKAIVVHESNLELMSLGIFNKWIEKSLQELAEVMPARYNRPEAEGPVMMSLESYTYEIENQATHDKLVDEDNASSVVGAPDQQIPSGDDQEAAGVTNGALNQSLPTNIQPALQDAASQVSYDNAGAIKQNSKQ